MRKDSRDGLLRPGMTATADIVVQEVNDALLVPNAALRYAPPQQEEKMARQSGGSLLSKLFPRPSRSKPKKSDGNGDGSMIKDPELRKPYARHLGGVNAGFMDGHAAWFNSTAFVNAIKTCDFDGLGIWTHYEIPPSETYTPQDAVNDCCGDPAMVTLF